MAGPSAINLTGNSFDNMIIGNEGANILHGGGGGGDVLIGMLGDDIYYTDVATTQVVEVAGGGTDAIYTSVSYTLGGNAVVELLSTNSHAATSAINLIGNHLAQTLVGNAGANILHGGGGADMLIGWPATTSIMPTSPRPRWSRRPAAATTPSTRASAMCLQRPGDRSAVDQRPCAAPPRST